MDRLVPTDDGGYIELNQDGVPIGEWHQDEDGNWIFDEYPPLAGLPQTGLLVWPIPVMAVIGVLLAAMGVYIIVNDNKKKKEHNEN